MISSLRNTLFATACLLLSISAVRAQHGLKVQFYDGVNFDKLVSERFVDNIDNYWDDQPPVPGIDPHQCSIRWRAKLVPGKSGTYLFAARVDDGIRVWIDDKLIINQWDLNDVGVFESSIQLTAYQEYKIKVEYFNALLEGEVRLLWQIPGVVKEKTWTETFFGGYDPYSVIPREHFLYPDELEEVVPQKPVVSPAENSTPVATAKKQQKQPTRTVTPQESEPVINNPRITAVEAEKFIPKNIAFKRAETTILESSINELDVFAQFMMDHPKLSVKIEGHTDPVGDEDLNLKLSKQRAYKIANYLANKGISRSRIQAEGFGGSRPLVVPKKGEYYPANRRVVFILDGFE